MSKFKIRESYLLLLIVLGLVSLGIYTTYALFTASTTINDVVGITATLDIGKSLTEYEVITVQPNETKLIELNVVNSYNGNIYYGAWYQIVKGNSSDIDIGLYTEKNSNSGSGSLSASSNINLLVGIINNGTSSITLYIGVKGSLTNELNLGTGKILIPDGFTEEYKITVNITNGTINNSTTSTIKVKKGNNAIFNVTPNVGYQLDIDTQTCNGTLTSDGVFTISDIIKSKECSLTLKEAVNLDTSGANAPDLVDGLIPVMYDGNKWVKADQNNYNETYKWYDYNNKLWANAVLVTSTNRSTYQSANPGTTITESDILAYYVWIPRYKYKVWNINKVIGTDSYNARTTGIDIVFENEKETNGTIKCTYDFSITDYSKLSETCTGSNGDYYTHPAFTFGSDSVRGFWMGKFELSSSSPYGGSSHGGDVSTSLTVRILPNVTSWRNNTISNFNTVIQNMQVSGNIYGLNTSRANTDSHMITNIEWGAVAYLTNSKYGRCTNGSCQEVAKNDYGTENLDDTGADQYYTTQTGCGSISNTGFSSSCYAYTTTYGLNASTTGNITGVYDMSGGAYESVMASMSGSYGKYSFYSNGSGLADDWYTTSTSKYLTPYPYTSGSSGSDQSSYNRSYLGDAIAEVTGTSDNWYSDSVSLVYERRLIIIPYNYSWLYRGGGFKNTTDAGIFFADCDYGSSSVARTTRAILVSLK